MIVHDEETVDEALQLIRQHGSVRYSDQYMYAVITDPVTLEDRCRTALERNDIVVVVPVGEEKTMEDHSLNLRRIRKERQEEEKKAIRTYVAEHPAEIAKVMKKLPKGKKEAE